MAIFQRLLYLNARVAKLYNLSIMGLAKLKTKNSVEDYLEGEKISPVKYEYVYGEVYAMAGTSDNHNRIGITDWQIGWTNEPKS